MATLIDTARSELGMLAAISRAVESTILDAPQGSGGFGYDPLFVPNGHSKSFAQLGSEIKNSLSHRARALEQLHKALLHPQRSPGLGD